MIALVIAVIFFHIISVPLVFGVSFQIDYDNDSGHICVRLFGIRIFKRNIDPKPIKRAIEGIPVQNASDRDENKQESGDIPIGFLFTFAKECLKRIRARDFEFSAAIGLGDAAATAVSVGALLVAYRELCGFLGVKEKSRISTEYSGERLYLGFFGIFSLCIGDIIFALAYTVFIAIRQKHVSSRRKKRRVYANNASE